MIVEKWNSDESFKLDLEHGGKVTYIADFLSEDEIANIMSHLIVDVNWVQGEYNMFGKPVKTPRLLAAMGELNEKYKITGTMDFTPEILPLKEKIEARFKREIKYAQLNYYQTGSDYIGWHSDKEVEPGDFIYSISVGAERRFQIRPINYKDLDEYIKYDIVLGSGSIIVMDCDAVKNNYKHQLFKEPKITEPRINITFRNK
jgi:alkylated DNA repair dioxygenase AlkB